MERYDFDVIVDREGTASVKYDIRKLIFGKEEVLPMWVADMDFKTPPFVMDGIRKRAEHELLGYTIRTDAYHQSLIDWVEQRHQWKIRKNWIEFSPGIVPALSLLVMTYANPGEKVIVQPPVYFPFFSTVEQNGCHVIHNPLKREGDTYKMDLENLASQIDHRTRMIFLCNPHNPVGRAWSREELKALGDLCVEKDILIVSDEIHCDLVLPGHKHIPMASLSEDIAKQTISCMAPSKTFNMAGMATSHIIIPDEKLRQRFKITMERIHVGMGNIFGAVATEAAYRNGEAWLSQMLDYVKGNVDFLGRYLEDNVPGIRMIRPEATYMAWLDCRELGMEDKELKSFMIEKAGLGLNDGPSFGKGGSGYQRINLACPRETVELAAEKLARAMNELKGV